MKNLSVARVGESCSKWLAPGAKTRYGCAARDKRGFESMGLERAGESPGTHQVADAEQVLHIKQNFWTGVHGVAFAILSP